MSKLLDMLTKYNTCRKLTTEQNDIVKSIISNETCIIKLDKLDKLIQGYYNISGLDGYTLSTAYLSLTADDFYAFYLFNYGGYLGIGALNKNGKHCCFTVSMPIPYDTILVKWEDVAKMLHRDYEKFSRFYIFTGFEYQQFKSIESELKR